MSMDDWWSCKADGILNGQGIFGAYTIVLCCIFKKAIEIRQEARSEAVGSERENEVPVMSVAEGRASLNTSSWINGTTRKAMQERRRATGSVKREEGRGGGKYKFPKATGERASLEDNWVQRKPLLDALWWPPAWESSLPSQRDRGSLGRGGGQGQLQWTDPKKGQAGAGHAAVAGVAGYREIGARRRAAC